MRSAKHERRGESSSRIDAYVEEGLRRFAQTTSRRSFMGKLGGSVLGVAGVTVAHHSILPRDTRVSASSSCSDWQYCGLSGYTCASCDEGGSNISCPNECIEGNAWLACCNWISQCNYYVSYRDCCGCSLTGCQHCNNADVDNWCAGIGSYGCTLARVEGGCPPDPGCP